MRELMKHLAYHCYPVRGNGAWQWNLNQIRLRIGLFDGRRIIAIVVDDTTNAAGDVMGHMSGCDVEFIVKHNDSELGEVSTWIDLWSQLKGEPGVTFRAHAKGVSSVNKKEIIKCRDAVDGITFKRSWESDVPDLNRVATKRMWAEMMYSACLDNRDEVMDFLDKFSIVGPFKQKSDREIKLKLPEELAKETPDWRFLGSFWWVRNEELSKRDWKGITKSYWGVETWPGLNFNDEESTCLVKEIPTGAKMDFTLVKTLYEEWRNEQERNSSLVG